MGHRDPRQDQKARVVGDEAEIAAPHLRRPADEAVAWGEVPRRRGPGDAGDRPPSRHDEIFEVRADRLLIPEIVVLRQEAVDERFVRGATHLVHDQRPQRVQRHRDRRRVDQDRRRARARPPRLAGGPLRRRELDVAGAMQPQEQAAADRIARRAIRLPPVPRVAHRERQPAPAEARRRRQERANRGEIGGRDRPAAVREVLFHERQRS